MLPRWEGIRGWGHRSTGGPGRNFWGDGGEPQAQDSHRVGGWFESRFQRLEGFGAMIPRPMAWAGVEARLWRWRQGGQAPRGRCQPKPRPNGLGIRDMRIDSSPEAGDSNAAGRRWYRCKFGSRFQRLEGLGAGIPRPMDWAGLESRRWRWGFGRYGTNYRTDQARWRKPRKFWWVMAARAAGE